MLPIPDEEPMGCGVLKMKRGKWDRKERGKVKDKCADFITVHKFNGLSLWERIILHLSIEVKINPVIFFGHENMHRSALCHF